MVMVCKKDQDRLRITIRGAVQGVGFRPFIYRLAVQMRLTGWVSNFSGGVWIEIEGEHERLEEFLLRIEPERPVNSAIQSMESSFLDAVGYSAFEIRASRGTARRAPTAEKSAWVLPDIATCADCLIDLFDPGNRRYLYPFTNCTHCGPRFSIIEGIPYDRCNTTMKKFVMCDSCQREYDDPLDRRFHAQPNACPQCGPHLELWDNKGNVHVGAGLPRPYKGNHRGLPLHAACVRTATDAIRHGKIVAVKGIGGFHLMVDARNEEAVNRLRQLKRREEKPFALMFPSLELIKEFCDVGASFKPAPTLEERLLCSPEAPIVLLKRKNVGADLRVRPRQEGAHIGAPLHSVAPNNPYLGVMLPYTPLHHLLMRELEFPVVATSGNVTDEPICVDEKEALQRLGGIADLFLVHNRPIVRPIDDSIVRVMMGRELLLRRARGYAPLPIHVGATVEGDCPPARGGQAKRIVPNENVGAVREPPLLAVGGHLKNTIAISLGHDVFLSQHIGDLETPQALESFQKTIADLSRLYECEATKIVHDLHPDYRSTQFAKQSNLPKISVQHHYAHVLSCMAENELIGKDVLGVAWDGTGYGLDGTIWGGEFLCVGAGLPRPYEGNHRGSPLQFDRAAHFRTFRLPGGEKAIKEPRRSAIGLLYEIYGETIFDVGAGLPRPYEGNHGGLPLQNFSQEEHNILRAMLKKSLNTPVTSSVGRLFDAVASILGIRQQTKFEGQAAMELEFAAEGIEVDDGYPICIRDDHNLECRGGPPCPPNRNVGAGLPRPYNGQPQGVAPTLIIDWEPMIREILEDLARQVPVGIISAKFHNTLAETVVKTAGFVGEERIVLTGGCFQNRYLTERTVKRLLEEGFRPYWHQRVPPNDGGIALGQIVAGAYTCA